MSGEVIIEPTKVKIVTKKGEIKWVEFAIRLIKNGDKIIEFMG